MLYLVPTPIGNLGDFTSRAVDTLNRVEYVLCEDTRHSQKLMHHFEIKTRLLSYHKFNEAEREESILSDLKSGKDIALISDGGTPGIADPGERLVRRCHEEGLPVTSLPGACAITVAVSAAGAPAPFQFIGFLPKKEGELRRALINAVHYPGTTVAYEAPKRIRTTLEMLGEARVCLLRELTKKFEEVRWGTAIELLKDLEERGEIVLLIQGNAENEWQAMEPRAHVEWLVNTFGVSENEAIKLAASLRGAPKREIYREVKG